MAAKSTIKIDVDSAEFVAFAEKFNKYAELLKSVPDTWKNVSKSTAVAKTNFETAAEAVGITAESMASIQKSGTEFYHVTESTARHWKNLAISTGSVAKNIVAATESLLKWTGILGLVTGGAGLFGFDRLAHSVSSQRTSALGTGGDYGKRSAFVTAFRRFGDPEGLLARVAEAQANQGVGLRQLGLSEKEMKGDPADVAVRAERALAKLAGNIPESQLGIDPHIKCFSVEEARRAKAHPEEIEEAANSFRQNQGALGLSPKDQLAYTNFTTQLEKAGREIETIFVKGLVADPLSKLSDDVIKLAEKFTDKGGPLDTVVTDLGKGIEWLAGEIDKPEFQKGVDSFIGKIGDLAGGVGALLTAIEKIAAWFGVGTGTGSPGGLSSLSDSAATPLQGGGSLAGSAAGLVFAVVAEPLLK
jgi:prophage DNA circulation protein